MTDRLGSVGTRIDIDVRAGDSFEYLFDDMRDESGALVDFTGCTFGGSMISLRGDSVAADLPLAVTITGLGAYKVAFVGSTAAWVAGDFFTPRATYNYKVRMTDTAGVVTTEWYGLIHVAAELPA